MRALVLLPLCFLVASAALRREKRGAMAMAGGWPFGVGTGVFSGFPGFPSPFAGTGFPGFTSPFDYPRAYMPMPMPWPVFTFPKPWYEGENVCVTTKEVQDPQELQEFFSEVSSSNLDYSHESEQCQGNGAKYVCFKRYVSNGESKMRVTKYECCYGFVRNPNGPGCIENNPPAQTTGGRSQDYYSFPQQQQPGRQPQQKPEQQTGSSVSSTSSSKIGVGSVAAQ